MKYPKTMKRLSLDMLTGYQNQMTGFDSIRVREMMKCPELDIEKIQLTPPIWNPVYYLPGYKLRHQNQCRSAT